MNKAESVQIVEISREPGQKQWFPSMGLWRVVAPIRGPGCAAYAPKYHELKELNYTSSDFQKKIFWRGFPDGSSLGHVATRMLDVLLKLGCPVEAQELVITDSPVLSSGLPEVNARVWDAGSKPVESRDINTLTNDECVEVQCPSWTRSDSKNCVRMIFDEFGGAKNTTAFQYIQDSDVLWVPTEYIEERIISAFPKNKVVRVPYGIDTNIYSAQNRNASSRSDVLRIGYVGTTISRKGYDLVVETIKRCVGDSRLHFFLRISKTFFGFRDVSEIATLPNVTLVEEHLTPRGLADFYKSCDVVLAPARAEAFNIPVLEAMACGTVPIVPNGNAMDDFCPESCRLSVGANRIFISRPDSTSLDFIDPHAFGIYEALIWCLSHRDELSLKSRRGSEIASLYSWENVVRLFWKKVSKAIET